MHERTNSTCLLLSICAHQASSVAATPFLMPVREVSSDLIYVASATVFGPSVLYSLHCAAGYNDDLAWRDLQFPLVAFPGSLTPLLYDWRKAASSLLLPSLSTRLPHTRKRTRRKAGTDDLLSLGCRRDHLVGCPPLTGTLADPEGCQWRSHILCR